MEEGIYISRYAHVEPCNEMYSCRCSPGSIVNINNFEAPNEYQPNA
jgi:hypothetical protein